MHLRDNGVEWLPLDCNVPPSCFQADVDSTGKVSAEVFIDNGSLRPLTARALRGHKHAFSRPGIVFTCTDLAADSIRELQSIAHEHGAPFWLTPFLFQD